MAIFRFNQIHLSDDQRYAFVTAIRTLKARGKYDPYVKTHWDYQNAGHAGPAFLPWHREFLMKFEKDLQEAGLPFGLPYWDWSDGTTDIWDSGLMGGDSGQVSNGPFAWKTGQWPLNVRTPEEPNPWLIRNFSKTLSLPKPQDVADTLAATPYDVDPWNDGSQSGFRNRLEGFVPFGMHNLIHAWVGGSMVPMTSPNDPVFWMHHCFIDKLWGDWQTLHPNEAAYQPTHGARPGHNLYDPMPPWNDRRPADLLDHHALGYRYDTDDYLGPGDALNPFQWMYSGNGNFMGWLSGDGRLHGSNWEPMWNSGPPNPNTGSSRNLIMGRDGNLVSYDVNGRPIWSAPPAPAESYLIVENTGNLAIYPPSGGEPVWQEPKG